jgi:O-succinylhomoserine sulfhydrylase
MSLHPITQSYTYTLRNERMKWSILPPLFLTSSFTFDNAEDMRAAFADETDVYI